MSKLTESKEDMVAVPRRLLNSLVAMTDDTRRLDDLDAFFQIEGEMSAREFADLLRIDPRRREHIAAALRQLLSDGGQTHDPESAGDQALED